MPLADYTSHEPIIKYLKLKQVMEITTLSCATIYRLMAKQRFPANIRLSPQRVAWDEKEILQWVDHRGRKTRDGKWTLAPVSADE